MSLPAMSLCEGGTGGGGWVHPKGASSMAMCLGLGCRNAFTVGTAWGFHIWHAFVGFQRALIECLIIDGCGPIAEVRV